MATNALIVHQLPQRIRLRIPEYRGDTAYFDKLKEKIRSIDNVRNVKTYPLTGGIAIEFDGNADDLLNKVQQHELNIQVDENLIEKKSKSALRKNLSRPLNLVTGREITPMFMVGSVLAVVSLVQTLRGKILVPSISGFWYATQAFKQSGKSRRQP